MTATTNTFKPTGLLRNRHIQSMLVSSPPRRWRIKNQVRDYQANSQFEIVATPKGPRLLAKRTMAKTSAEGNNKPKARVILLHGWEGSVDSSYLLAVGNALWQSGCETIRLNFRDHGTSHFLNRGLFHSCRLDEVVDAVKILTADSKVPVFIVGFSLGGNFALRVTNRAHAFPVVPSHTFAISPVIVPRHVLDAMEQGLPIYQKYFIGKWGKSLRKKAELFPDEYQFGDWFKLKGLHAMTEMLVERYTEYSEVEDYFRGYSIDGDYLSGLQVPTTIITANDDPIIPIDDFALLPDNPNLNIETYTYGGHCGFIQNWGLTSWLEQELVGRVTTQLNTLINTVTD